MKTIEMMTVMPVQKEVIPTTTCEMIDLKKENHPESNGSTPNDIVEEV